MKKTSFVTLQFIRSMSFFDLSFPSVSGEMIPFEMFKGKVCMVVNMASHCTWTPQLKGLQELYNKYHAAGFEILAFPSNDFGKQEPMNNREIERFCRHDYHCEFPLFEKSGVVGPEANPVFKFLRSQFFLGNIISRPRWNFHKYLVDRKGNAAGFYFTTTHPMSNRVQKKIEKLLREE